MTLRTAITAWSWPQYWFLIFDAKYPLVLTWPTLFYLDRVVWGLHWCFSLVLRLVLTLQLSRICFQLEKTNYLKKLSCVLLSLFQSCGFNITDFYIYYSPVFCINILKPLVLFYLYCIWLHSTHTYINMCIPENQILY